MANPEENGNDARLPPEDLRRTLDEAVHAGVSQRIEQIPAAIRTDPASSCILYALVGVGILRRYVGDGYLLQAGSFQLALEDGHFAVFQAGKAIAYHAWIGRVGPGQRVELVDFAARHYGSLLNHVGAPAPSDLPTTGIWDWEDDVADRVLFRPEADHIRQLAQRREQLDRLVGEAEEIAIRVLHEGGIPPD